MTEHPATPDTQDSAQLEYGETVPGIVCPACGGELVHTSLGAFCEWDSSYVPVVGTPAIVDDDDGWDEYDEWDDEYDDDQLSES